MKIARLEFFGMHRLVEMNDNAHYYEIALPTKPIIAKTLEKRALQKKINM